jgi:serine/threonine-protein kinase
MATASLANLIDQVRRSQLLAEEQQHELAGTLRNSFPEPRELARELIRRQWLTVYQVNQIAAGRGGDLVIGAYELLERIGEGGMGQVYRARHRTLGRTVALKLLRKECVDNPTIIRRFQREVQMAAQLQHPHIVRAFDADQVGGTYYFVMEFIEGIDLARLVKDHGPLRLPQACDYVRQAALGLQHAHEHGMIHRDVKPANLLVSRPGGAAKGHSTLLPRPYAQALQWGVVKILDMGLARLQDGEDRSGGTMLTQIGSVMGTPDFISPEQARCSHTADIRSDLYGLGCTFYFLLTGQAPFPKGTLTEKLLKHQLEEPEPLEQVRKARLCERLMPGGPVSLRDDPALLAAVVGVVRRLMAKQPEDRHQTPAELADALTDLARKAPAPASRSTASVKKPKAVSGAAPAAVPVALPVQAPEQSPGPQSTTTLVALPVATAVVPRPRPVRRWRRTAAVAGLVTFLGLGLGVAAGLLPGQAPRTEEAPPDAHPAPAPAALTEEERAWQKLQARIDRPEGDALLLRRDLVAFRARYPHSPAGKSVAAVLVNLPSALDRLPVTKVLPKERIGWQPRELVATLGERKAPASAAVQCVAFSPDGQQLARGAADGTVRLWDAATLREAPAVAGHTGAVLALAFAPDGRTLATAGQDGAVHVWDAATGKAVASLREHKAPVVALAFHPEGKTLVSLGRDGTLKFWAPGAEQPALTLAPGKDLWPISLAFSPDGHVLACGQTDGKVRLVALEKHQVSGTFAAHATAARALVFGPDGATLAVVGQDGTVKLHDWDGARLTERATLKGHKGAVQAAFSPDGRQLYTGGADRSLKVWEVATGKKQHDQENLLQGIAHLAPAPDGRHLAAAGPGSLVAVVRLTGAPKER